MQFEEFGDHVCTEKNIIPIKEFLEKRKVTTSLLFLFKIPVKHQMAFEEAMKKIIAIGIFIF